MRRLVIDLDDPRTSAALDELEALIKSHYPDATFDRAIGEDPAGAYLVVAVNVDDTFEVQDVYRDRIIEMQEDERLRVYVHLTWPEHRIAEYVRQMGWVKDEPPAASTPRRTRRKPAAPRTGN